MERELGHSVQFYYRPHILVLLIEYDKHPEIFLDNDEPEPFHVHIIVRTPNGGDHGKEPPAPAPRSESPLRGRR